VALCTLPCPSRPTPTLTIRKAEPADLDTLEEPRVEAVAWLASKGLDQWQPGQPRIPTRKTTAAAIARGVCYLAYDQDDELVGTITVHDQADPEFWTPTEQTQPAFYVHRMIIRRAAAGADLGAYLLDWACGLAARNGRRWLRLDAWKTNKALHLYYERHGFSHVRTVDLPHRGSGACFQRPCSVAGRSRRTA
jgi:GNAT superfamily N-acetyltransferase